MIGLSLTAIGNRPLDQALATFTKLQPELNLEYLELAIGVQCDRNANYPDVPLVLHDHCLFKGYQRLYSNRPSHVKFYQEFIDTHNVIAMHVHAPRGYSYSTLDSAKEYLTNLQASYPNTLLCVENMPDNHYWLSSVKECGLLQLPLVLDVSHVNIWAKGDQKLTEEMTSTILERDDVRCLHLSHNCGDRDSHQVIPDSVWFHDSIAEWSTKYFVTYESLPKKYKEYSKYKP
jgi:hypothetical protein